ncbi:MAG: hypothetical protein NTX65_12970 [Ignavibacteriales bacterium]|nr:hypothetical protein [Ignavibacteriales bacterium]
MDKLNNRYLVIALVVIAVLFLYFGSGTLMDGGMNEGMHENGWMSGNNWRWFPTIATLVVGVFIGWLLFRKKK